MDLNVPEYPKGAAKKLAIIALGEGQNISETARIVGRSRKTISRWLKIPKFAAAVSELLESNLSRAQGILFRSLETAAETPKRIMGDLEHPAAALAASKYVLNIHGLGRPAPPPPRPNVREELNIGDTLEVHKIEGKAVIVAVPNEDSPPNADPKAGPEPAAASNS